MSPSGEPFSIAGSTVVVTGGASGIGLALARRFAVDGAATVVIADLDGDRAANAASTLEGRGRYQAVELDVTDPGAVADTVAAIEARHAPIDVWCSNAGIATGRDLGADADWAAAWAVHVMAHVYAARAVLPGMVARGHGHFMITASAAGLLTEMDLAPYAVTKHGAVAIAEWLAIRYGGRGVGISCLCPQGVRTRMLADASADSSTLAASGLLEPDQVADAVMAALAENRFLVLPHPEVAEYAQRRAGDPDRWIAGMRRVWSRLHPDDG